MARQSALRSFAVHFSSVRLQYGRAGADWTVGSCDSESIGVDHSRRDPSLELPESIPFRSRNWKSPRYRRMAAPD